ncbi:N-acetylglucosamine-6-sulfatase-like [Choristoneura fumiferana]|uniref:N-acetylglucosamine-6-sulfatase-like n=1 Tax=Choristoneura fumiferana TaxID=7141 RepID=UPI003D15C301
MLNYLLLILFAGGTVCDQRPNFVVVLTDDQDVTMGGMSPMKNVRRFIGERGMTFTNSFVTSPICCPSRASLLTGLYVHNHMTRNNTERGGCYGARWRKLEQQTFATALKEAGYSTFYAGKYMNQGYSSTHPGIGGAVPPGWTEWHGLVGNSVYYNYTLSNNGVPTYSADLYLTDIIRDLGINYLERQKEQPFLMVLAPPAPHQPFTPAERHRGAFGNTTVPRTPHFNIAVEDKHWLMTMPPSPLPASILPELDRAYSSRWESLLAVDEMVADVMAMLEKNNVMKDTYVIYTSDNGYHVGQFSQVYDKRQPYESDIRVPLLIKGPGIKENVTSNQPVLNIDLAPTILALAGVNVSVGMDGRALDVTGASAESRTMLVEYFGEGKDGTVDPSCPWKYDSDHLAECNQLYICKCQDSTNNTYACIRHIGKNANYKYCEFRDRENFIEIYNIESDPYELVNIVDETFPALKAWYNHVMKRMLACKGAESCNFIEKE